MWYDIINSVDMSLSKLQGMVKDRGTWHAAVHGVAKSWTRLSDWTTTTSFMEDNFSMTQEAGDGFTVIQADYIYCTRYF